MRVLTLTTIYPNEFSDSEGRSIAKLDEALSTLGVEGTTIVLRPWWPRPLARVMPHYYRHLCVRNRSETRGGVRVIFDRYAHLPWRLRRDLSARWMAARAAWIVESRGLSFDVVHGQSAFPSGIAARLLAERWGLPFIVTLRDDPGHIAAMRRRGNADLRRLFDETLGHARAVLVHGPSVESGLRDLGLPGLAPVIIAPNGADIDGLERLLACLPPRGTRPDDEPRRVVSVCRLHPFKGVRENLLALKRLADGGLSRWTYSVVGDGPERPGLQSLTASLGLGGRVRFSGWLPHAEALRSIRDADVFSMPSWREAFGNVYAEAAVCGKPVIGCRGQGAEVTVRHGETGLLVAPRDVEGLAEALGYLLTRPGEALSMGARGRENIRAFTWTRTAALYRDRILAPQPAPPRR